MKHTLIFVTLIGLFAAGCGSAALAPAPPAHVAAGVDPEAWAIVPAGEFLMGLHDHETLVDYDYEVMVTDVTNTQYANYLNKALAAGAINIVDDEVLGYYPGDEFHGYNHEEEIEAGDWIHIRLDEEGLRLDYDGQIFTAKPGYESHPMVLVSWFGAKAYCDYSGWRLPTEVEWEKAARGADGRSYPWGDEIERHNANYYKSHDPFEEGVGGLGNTTPVGFYNGQTYDGYQTLDSPSPYGLYDMAGNVWQWTSDVYKDTHYRHLRGGGKADYAYDLRVWTRNSAGPDYMSPNAGFRCVRGTGE